jgi:hypothetical protein
VKRRALLLIGLGWMAIAAPTPGAVGSCGSDDLAEAANFSSYCQQREQLICTRRYLRKEITAETRDSCRWDAIDACDRRAFPSDCAPTKRETEGCLRALSSLDTLDTKEDKISECSQSALCKATPSEEEASGGGANSSVGENADADGGKP